MKKKIHLTKNAEETAALGASYANDCKDGCVLLLFGDLGSGKTTFTKGFAKELGVVRHVTSPTFLIVKSYNLGEGSDMMFYHMDLYRLSTQKEIQDMGIYEIFSTPKTISIVEWSEKLEENRPEKRIELHFEYRDENTRQIEERRYD